MATFSGSESSSNICLKIASALRIYQECNSQYLKFVLSSFRSFSVLDLGERLRCYPLLELRLHLLQLYFLYRNYLLYFLRVSGEETLLARAVVLSLDSVLLDEVVGADFDENVVCVLHDSRHIQAACHRDHDLLAFALLLQVDEHLFAFLEFSRADLKLIVRLRELLQLLLNCLGKLLQLLWCDLCDVDALFSLVHSFCKFCTLKKQINLN